jgi:hypothetical protein
VVKDGDIQSFYQGWDPRWDTQGWQGNAFGKTKVRSGTLLVDIFDGASSRVVWRSFATETLSDKSGENMVKIDEAAARLFKNFPPGKPKE